MVQIRLLTSDDAFALHGALSAFLAIPSDAREYLQAKKPHLHLLLSDLTADDLHALRLLRQGETEAALYPELLLGDRDRAHGRAMLSGRREQLERLARTLENPLGQAIAAALESSARPRWKLGDAPAPAKTLVMGVVNVTPDSFSDGGRFLGAEAAIAHGLRLAEEGADLLDIGGESTRPGGGVYGQGMQEVDDAEELARVIPVIRGLAKQTRLPLSIDTRKLPVARAALDAGATVINDVSGLRHAPGLAQLAAERKASLCLMHTPPGDFRTMQVAPSYEDVVGEVARFLAGAAAEAERAGVEPGRICVDPGLGFGKGRAHNVELLAAVPAFTALGYPVLIGASRKSFVGALTGVQAPAERLHGSLAAAVAAAMRGAAVLRVHDVRPTVEALAVADAVMFVRGPT